MKPHSVQLVKSLDDMIELDRKLAFFFLWMQILCMGETLCDGIDFWAHDYPWTDGVLCATWMVSLLLHRQLRAKITSKLVHTRTCRQMAIWMDFCKNDSQFQMCVDQFDAHFLEIL